MLVGLSEIFSLFHHRMGQISVTLNRCKYNNHNLLDYKRATADDGWWFLFFLFFVTVVDSFCNEMDCFSIKIFRRFSIKTKPPKNVKLTDSLSSSIAVLNKLVRCVIFCRGVFPLFCTFSLLFSILSDLFVIGLVDEKWKMKNQAAQPIVEWNVLAKTKNKSEKK